MLLFCETWFVILMLVLVPPFGMFLTFKYSEWEQKLKIIAVILSAVWLIVLIIGGCSLLGGKDEPVLETPPVVETPVVDNPAIETPPIEETPNTDKEKNENEEPRYDLSEEEVAALEKVERIEYTLSKSFLQDKRRAYEIKAKAVTKEKYDLTVNISSMDIENSKDILKLITKHLVALGYKDCIMEILINLETGNEIKIITVRDFSSEILPNVNCHIYEHGRISQDQIVFKVQ